MDIERPDHHEYSEEDVVRILEEQYAHPETIEVGKDRIEIIDLIPPVLKTETPMILVPGWSATAHVLKENIITLAKLGRRVIVGSAPHGVDVPKDKQYPHAELRKTEAVMQVLDHKGIANADIVSHSEAGIFMTMAAIKNQDRFRNMVLVSPAGMIGPDTFPRLAGDFMTDIVGQTQKALLHDRARLPKMVTAYSEAAGAIISDIPKTWQEMQAIVDTQIEHWLVELKERGHGISIVHGVHDKAFPFDRMRKIVTSSMVDGFMPVKGSHNEFYLKPHPMTELVDHLLNAMERKYGVPAPVEATDPS